MTLVTRINKIAKSRGMSLNKLEDELNFGNGSIRRWDERLPSFERLNEVADLLKVDTRYLFKGEPTSFNGPEEYKNLLKLYDQLTPENQTLIENMLYSFEEQFQVGKKEKAIKSAENMLKNNMSIADVMTYTDLEEKTIKKIKKKIKN